MKVSNSKNIYIISKKEYSLLTRLHGSVVCRVCSKSIEIGQKVLTTNHKYLKSKSNVRHFSCAKKVGII